MEKIDIEELTRELLPEMREKVKFYLTTLEKMTAADPIPVTIAVCLIGAILQNRLIESGELE